MGSRSSTAGTFIFLVTFLGVFAVMANSIPLDFVPAQGKRETSARNDWIISEMGDFNYTDGCNLTRGTYEDLNVGDVWLQVTWSTWDNNIRFFHYWYLWGIFPQYHDFDENPITLSDVETHQTENYANASYMMLNCPCPKLYHVYFIYNSTTYSSWSESWDAGELEIVVGMGWDDAIEEQSAWSLIFSILTFQAPEVFGASEGGLLMNSVIAVPFWAAFAILTAIIILWFIPLLGGE